MYRVRFPTLLEKLVQKSRTYKRKGDENLKLYALKCRSGYIKNDLNDLKEGYKCVDLKKASVYDENGLDKINEVMKLAEKNGFTDVRIVELEIIERDPYKVKSEKKL